MSTERRKILDMLAAGKISADEADELLTALGDKKEEEPKDETTQKDPGAKAKYMRIMVEDCCGGGKQVDMRIPFQLFRAGMKFSSMMPAESRDKIKEALKEKGVDIDFDQMKPEQMEEMLCCMGNMQIDINKGEKKVHICCE